MASIRSKIVLTLVSALIVAGLVASWATYYSTRSEFSAIFDGQLKHTAEEIVETGSVDISHITLVGQSPKLKLFVQIYDAHENRFYMSQHRNPLRLRKPWGSPTSRSPRASNGGNLRAPSARASSRSRSPRTCAMSSPCRPPCASCSPCSC